MLLSELKAGLPIVGLEPQAICTVIAVIPVTDQSVTLWYSLPGNNTGKNQLISAPDAVKLSVAVAEKPWSFDGDSAAFQLACEAKRIDLAFLFDPMMAVHTSNVEPLPHQITAVYQSLLPRQPLRFVLAFLFIISLSHNSRR